MLPSYFINRSLLTFSYSPKMSASVFWGFFFACAFEHFMHILAVFFYAASHNSHKNTWMVTHPSIFDMQTYVGRPISEFAPEGHLDGVAMSGALVKRLARLEGRAVEVQADGRLRMAHVLHPMQSDGV